MNSKPVSRRQFLTTAAAGGAALLAGDASANLAVPKKRVGVAATVFHRNSHADVIVGKILNGWKEAGGPGPALELAALYVEQFPKSDLSRGLSRKHGFPIVDSIDQALTMGGDKLAVDGVISIAEHGNYPWNKKGQHLYPRRRFFDAICDTFVRCGSVVPVFNDKHPGPMWRDAKAMYDRAQKLEVPFMAGSSLPVSFRSPDATVPIGSKIGASVGIGYSGLDIYGFHTIDFLQCLLERRAGGESGVASVQCRTGADLPRLLEQGLIRRDLLDAALATTPHAEGPLGKADSSEFEIFLIKYRDGLTAPVLMLRGYAQGIAAAVDIEGKTIACRAEERVEPRFPHFAYLLKGVECMIHTGRPTYPVERTILSAGTLDRLLTSRSEGRKELATPELAIKYAPTRWSHAPHIDLLADPRVPVR